jgi:hypothetical protein
MFSLPVFYTDQLGYMICYDKMKQRRLQTVLAEPLEDITAVRRITGCGGRDNDQ